MNCQMSNYEKCSGILEMRNVLFKYIDYFNSVPDNTIMIPICQHHFNYMREWNCNKNDITNSNYIVATIDEGNIKEFCYPTQ